MKHLILFILVLFFFTNSSVLACTIIPKFFCENINTYHPTYVVMSGKIIDTIENGVRFEVFETLRGNETRDTVTIWDDVPYICLGPYPRKANKLGTINDSIVVALPKIDSTINAWEKMGDYRTPEVYAYFTTLRIEAGFVKGFVAGQAGGFNYVSVLHYDAFKESVVQQGACSRVVATSDFHLQNNLSVHPNPFRDQLFVTLPNFNAATLTYYITNMQGQILQQGNIANQTHIDTSDLPRGMYLLLIINQKGILLARQKVVKMQ